MLLVGIIDKYLFRRMVSMVKDLKWILKVMRGQASMNRHIRVTMESGKRQNFTPTLRVATNTCRSFFRMMNAMLD